MQKIVLSLGGSLIVPDRIDLDFLRKFKKVIGKYSKKRLENVGRTEKNKKFEHCDKISRGENS